MLLHLFRCKHGSVALDCIICPSRFVHSRLAFFRVTTSLLFQQPMDRSIDGPIVPAAHKGVRQRYRRGGSFKFKSHSIAKAGPLGEEEEEEEERRLLGSCTICLHTHGRALRMTPPPKELGNEIESQCRDRYTYAVMRALMRPSH